MSIFFRLIRIVRPWAGWMLLAAFLSFAATGSGIGLLMTAAYLIAKAALQPPLAALQIGIVGVRFFGLARGVLRYLERLASHDTTFRILTSLRLWFYDALEPLAPARLMQFRSADLLQRIVDDIQSLENLYTRVLAPPVTALLTALLLWFLLGFWSPLAAVILLSFHLLAGIGVPLLTARLSRGTASGILRWKAEEQMLALDFAQGLAELQMYGGIERHRKRLEHAESEKLALERKSALVDGMQETLIGLIMNAAVLGVLSAVLPEVSTGTLSGIALSIATLAVMASFEPFLPLPGSVRHLEADIHAGKRIFEILDATPEVTEPSSPRPIQGELPIEATALSFTYPGTLRPALDAVSFMILQGARVAIVGPSGSGKSTLTSLLVRFWNPGSGTLRIGRHPIEEYSPEALRRHIALVSQRTYVFAETIRENLLLARPGATDHELGKALRAAGLNHFPTRLGEFAGQHGMQLSGGERQRLAIARAILQDAPVVILDEATASLDAPTEQEVLRRIEEASEGKTIITITHRLQEMERFGSILVLKDGRLAETGTHTELMRKQGVYHAMWNSQHQSIDGQQ
ncbi:MAG: thiol reductant ABC exporter subunit CydC [Pelodictyon luteolum]|uniref:Thiol reductant ABC exporter subunit CydC n=1 Tax=Pelodictyon luteolum TaxID=1100 RepID=A0A165LL87_PELLU|nr:thiol reductant ABC exporter subunit CydC [Pelodictyon luteolum]KZK74180.1 MAG: thiol reductant ABC exporter subunit CydC [Pelodictyon luteolum]